VRINMIPREGGYDFKGAFYLSGSRIACLGQLLNALVEAGMAR
jgi:hypothetical protein